MDNFNRKTDKIMGVGIKIKRLREERKISQPELAELLNISQSTLSNIESEASKKIDFLLMDKVCKIFDKDFEYFVDEKTINNVDKNEGGVVGINHGTINNFPENIIEQIKSLIESSKAKDSQIEELTKRISELEKK
nr:helix-turn-helix transcriptional regulator [Moheibacter sediminis]